MLSCSLCNVYVFVLCKFETQIKLMLLQVQDLVFSRDARWVCASTTNGTTHVFPVTPYGGPITARTHTCPKLVNKHSRYLNFPFGIYFVVFSHPFFRVDFLILILILIYYVYLWFLGVLIS